MNLRTAKDINLISLSIILLCGMITLYNAQISFLLIVGFLATMAFIKMPHLALSAVILILPFSNFDILQQQIGGIPGMKIPNLLPLLAFFAYLYSQKKFSLGRLELFFLVAIIAFLIIGTVRSIPYLYMINWSLDPKLGTAKYILTYLVRPIIYLFPFIIIAAYVHDKNSIKYVNKAIMISVLFLSSYLILFYAIEAPGYSFASARYIISDEFNIHRNDIVNFYILTYPLLLANFLSQKSMFNFSNLTLCLVSVAILYSRTGYAMIIFSTLLFFSLTKNKRWIPALILAGICILTFLPLEIVERSTKGFTSGNINLITAGRVHDIWMPLIKEISQDPVSLFFGRGINAIKYTQAYVRDYILNVGHAHNMYLNVVLELGLLGLAFFIWFYGQYLKRVYSNINKNDAFYFLMLNGVLVSIIAFLLSGFSGRELLPTLNNAYLWIILAFGLSMVHANRKASESAPDANITT